MRLGIVIVAVALLAGCVDGGYQRPFTKARDGEAVSSAGAAATEDTVAGLKDKGALPEKGAKGGKVHMQAKSPVIIEITVNPESREDMQRLIPYLLNEDEWQIVGVISHSNNHRTWRFMRMGVDDRTRVHPLERDIKKEKKIDLKNLTPLKPGSKPGRQRDDAIEKGRGVDNPYNPYDPH